MPILTSKWAKFIKWIFVFNNFVFLLVGIAAIGYGLWGVTEADKVFDEEWSPILGDDKLQEGDEWLIEGFIYSFAETCVRP